MKQEDESKLGKVSELLGEVYGLCFGKITNAEYEVTNSYTRAGKIILFVDSVKSRPMTLDRAFEALRRNLQAIKNNVTCTKNGANIAIFYSDTRIATIIEAFDTKSNEKTLAVDFEKEILSADIVAKIVNAISSYKELWLQAKEDKNGRQKSDEA